MTARHVLPLCLLMLACPGESAPTRTPRTACLNPGAVQVALDACLSAQLKLGSPSATLTGERLMRDCLDWATEIACVPVSLPPPKPTITITPHVRGGIEVVNDSTAPVTCAGGPNTPGERGAWVAPRSGDPGTGGTVWLPIEQVTCTIGTLHP